MSSEILKAAILQILKDRDDEPAPEKYVMLALNVHYRIKPSWSELRAAMKDMDESRLLLGLTEDDKTVLWSLSTKGKHKLLSRPDLRLGRTERVDQAIFEIAGSGVGKGVACRET